MIADRCLTLRDRLRSETGCVPAIGNESGAVKNVLRVTFLEEF